MTADEIRARISPRRSHRRPSEVRGARADPDMTLEPASHPHVPYVFVRMGGLAERLREGVATASFPVVGRVTVSVGVAAGPTHASSPRELITCADLAMLEAKRIGKNRVRAYIEAAPKLHLQSSLFGAGDEALGAEALEGISDSTKGNGGRGNGKGRKGQSDQRAPARRAHPLTPCRVVRAHPPQR